MGPGITRGPAGSGQAALVAAEHLVHGRLAAALFALGVPSRTAAGATAATAVGVDLIASGGSGARRSPGDHRLSTSSTGEPCHREDVGAVALKEV